MQKTIQFQLAIECSQHPCGLVIVVTAIALVCCWVFWSFTGAKKTVRSHILTCITKPSGLLDHDCKDHGLLLSSWVTYWFYTTITNSKHCRYKNLSIYITHLYCRRRVLVWERVRRLREFLYYMLWHQQMLSSSCTVGSNRLM